MVEIYNEKLMDLFNPLTNSYKEIKMKEYIPSLLLVPVITGRKKKEIWQTYFQIATNPIILLLQKKKMNIYKNLWPGLN